MLNHYIWVYLLIGSVVGLLHVPQVIRAYRDLPHRHMIEEFWGETTGYLLVTSSAFVCNVVAWPYRIVRMIVKLLSTTKEGKR